MKKEVWILGAIGVVVIVGYFLISGSYKSDVRNTSVTNTSNANTARANAEALVRPDSWKMGPDDAKVTVVEFYDPECESCAAFAPIMKRVMALYQGRVRLVMRYMPLHPNSVRAATFTEAAGEQGKYWQAQEYLFQKQPEWGERHGAPAGQQADVASLFAKYAADLGLDPQKVKAAETDRRFLDKLERDKRDGQALGATRTPTIFVNGRKLTRLSEDELKSVIDEELLPR